MKQGLIKVHFYLVLNKPSFLQKLSLFETGINFIYTKYQVIRKVFKVFLKRCFPKSQVLLSILCTKVNNFHGLHKNILFHLSLHYNKSCL